MTKKKNKNAAPVPVQPVQPPAPAQVPINRSKLPVLILVALMILGGGWFLYQRNKAQVAPGAFRDYNVLLITMDTTRADHLPAYGYKNVKTPNLDSVASSGFVFDDAVSHVPITLASHASILTGKLPIAHGIHDNSGYKLDPKETTLAEILKNQGYTTSAFVSSFVLDSRWQLNQGFDFYFDNFNAAEYEGINPREIQRRGEDTEAEASHWLEQNSSKKFFTWVHFYDPHDPYDPPEPYRSEYKSKPYDGEIAYTDEQIGKLLDKLQALGVRDHTIVIITADHGEGLGEHQEPTHGIFLYNTTQHVPLMIQVPGKPGRRIDGIVGHIDLAPTILDLLGLQPSGEMQGSSLIPILNGKEKSQRLAFSESKYAEIHFGWSPLQSITSNQYRYIQAPHPELYDWKADPGETKNLISEKASVAKVLANDLKEVIARDTSGEQKGPQKMDAETEEKMRALGYIGGSAPSTAESQKIDPKDKIRLMNGILEASGYTMVGNYPAALQKVIPVLREDPDMMEGHYIAGIAFAGVGQYPQAIDELMKTIRLKPDHTTALYNLAYAYQITGDYKSAEFFYRKILTYEPQHVSAMTKLATMYAQAKRQDLALPYLQSALAFYGDSLKKTNSGKARSALYTSIAEIYFIGGDLKKAAESLTMAIDLTPRKPNLHYNLAQVYEAGGRKEIALQEYRKETEVDPTSFKAYYNLGSLYAETGNLQDAAYCLEKVTQLSPKDPKGFAMLAEIYKELGRTDEAAKILKSLRPAK